MRNVLLLLPLLAACAADATAPSADTASVESRAPTYAFAQLNGDVWRARVGGLTMRLQRTATVSPGGLFGGPLVTVQGTTSEPIQDIWTWIPDDGFATVNLTGPRSFEIALDEPSEVNTMLAGLPLYFTVVTQNGATGTRTHHGQITWEATPVVQSAPAGVALSPLASIFVRNLGDDLRYRGTVSGPAPLVRLGARTTDGLAPTPNLGRSAVDFTYDQLQALLLPTTDRLTLDVGFADGTAGQVVAALGLQASLTGITTTYPYDFPRFDPYACEEDVLACALAETGPDLSECGNNRDVSLCWNEDPCVMSGPGTPALYGTWPGDLPTVVADFDAACGTGGTWCSADEPLAFDVTACGGTLEGVVEAVRALRQDFASHEWVWGDAYEGADVFSNPWWFGTGYSSEGPRLRDEIAAWAGGSDVVGWFSTYEVPCPNCTDFADLAVIWFRDTNKVVVLFGTHGYDS